MEAFPSNSQSRTTEKAKPEKLEQIITSGVTQRKRPLTRRFMETFVGGDARGTLMFVVGDILVPAAKDMMAEAFTQGFERMIFGESRSGGRRSSFRGPGPTNYNSYSRPGPGRGIGRERDEPREMSRRGRATHEFDEIILDSRAEADLVLQRLEEHIEEYEVATVASLYELVGITSQHTDGKWGWDNLRDARVERLRGGGYLLDLPKTKPVD